MRVQKIWCYHTDMRNIERRERHANSMQDGMMAYNINSNNDTYYRHTSKYSTAVCIWHTFMRLLAYNLWHISSLQHLQGGVIWYGKMKDFERYAFVRFQIYKSWPQSKSDGIGGTALCKSDFNFMNLSWNHFYSLPIRHLYKFRRFAILKVSTQQPLIISFKYSFYGTLWSNG